jgi:hypothetical protein
MPRLWRDHYPGASRHPFASEGDYVPIRATTPSARRDTSVLARGHPSTEGNFGSAGLARLLRFARNDK